jgi:hypothetical protein
MRPTQRTSNPAELELPFRAVDCPFCTCEVAVEQMSLIEALWMHEYECAGIAPLMKLAPAAAA